MFDVRVRGYRWGRVDVDVVIVINNTEQIKRFILTTVFKISSSVNRLTFGQIATIILPNMSR